MRVQGLFLEVPRLLELFLAKDAPSEHCHRTNGIRMIWPEDALECLKHLLKKFPGTVEFVLLPADHGDD